jgi:hypothetical protein
MLDQERYGKPGEPRRREVSQSHAAQRACRERFRAQETESMLLVTRTPTALEIGHCALPNRVGLGPVWRVSLRLEHVRNLQRYKTRQHRYSIEN